MFDQLEWKKFVDIEIWQLTTASAFINVILQSR